MADDLLGRLLRDDAELRLRPRQRGLEIEIFLHAVLVGENLPHRLGREDVAEHGGVDGGRWHGRRFSRSGAQLTRCSGGIKRARQAAASGRAALIDTPPHLRLNWPHEFASEPRCRDRRAGAAAAPAGDRGSGVSALQRRRDRPSPRCDRRPAGHRRPRPSGVLRRQPLRLRGAMADALAGHHRGDRHLQPRQSRHVVRPARQSRAACAADRRRRRGRLGRTVVDPRHDRGAGEPRRAVGPRRRDRADDVRAARDAVGALRQDRQSQSRLRATAPDQVGRRAQLDAHRRRLHRSRHDVAAQQPAAGPHRAKSRRRGRALLRLGGRHQRHPLFRRHLDVRCACRGAGAICGQSQGQARRHRVRRNQRRVLGASRPGAAQLRGRRRPAKALSRAARGRRCRLRRHRQGAQGTAPCRRM